MAGTAALVAILSTGAALADTTTLFTDFPSNQFEALGIGDFGPVDVAWANQFTAGSTAYLSDAILALGNYAGTNSPITVDLESDVSGLPGTILATLTQQGAIPQYSSPGPVTFDYSGAPVQLTSGTSYWLVATEADPNSQQAWFLSNTTSGLDAYNYNGSATGPWTAGCAGSGCTDGLNAFQVDGTTTLPTTPVPEPSALPILALALIACAAAAYADGRKRPSAPQLD